MARKRVGRGGMASFFCLFAFYIVSLQIVLCRVFWRKVFIFNEINKCIAMNKSENSLVVGLERLALIASRIRKNEGAVPQIEIDIILEELRNLYMVALKIEKDNPQEVKPDVLELDLSAAREMAEEEQRLAEEAAAKRAAEEKRLADEAAAKKAAEEKRLAEEAAAKRAAEEKRLAEEAAAKRAAEEKRLAEEAAAKRAAEEKRKAAALAAEELKPVFAPDETTKAPEPVIEPQMERLEGNPNDELFADEPASAKREASLFDYISKESGSRGKRTLADTLNHPAHNVEEQLAGSVRAKKVDDLRTIININDKFSFMSELFHNNMKAYNDFILRLNATAERAEALGYVKAVAEEYKWDEGSVVVKSFYKIFDRKF